MPWYQRELCHYAQLASERGQRAQLASEHNHLAERHSKMLRELHEATAAAAALKADNAEKLKQLQLKEDALKAARSDVAKVTHVELAKHSLPLSFRNTANTKSLTESQLAQLERLSAGRFRCF